MIIRRVVAEVCSQSCRSPVVLLFGSPSPYLCSFLCANARHKSRHHPLQYHNRGDLKCDQFPSDQASWTVLQSYQQLASPNSSSTLVPFHSLADSIWLDVASC